ncbi:MAG: MFS transporter [Anaerolineales bacterium]|nr:MFS transporter [Anaerolineales bacterium]
MEPINKQPLLSPLLRWFMFAMVLANIASSMYPLLMPIYLTELGASVTQVGLIFTLTSVVILVLQIFGGWVSDSIGRLRSIAIGSVGGIFGFVAVLLAPTWQWMLAALCVLQFPYALVGPSFGAFIAENSTKENRGKVYGLTDTIFQITGVIGPPLGGFLVGRYGFKMMLLVSGSLYALAAILRIWMATTVRTTLEANPKALSTASLKTSLKTMFGMVIGGGVLTWIFITDGVRDIAFRLSGELQPLYLEQVAGISVEQIGILGSIFSIAMMFTPILSGKMVDKYGERVPISLGFLLVFGAFMIFLQVSTFLGFAVCWIVFGTGVGLLSPAYQSLISKVVPEKMLGTFSGLFRSSLGLISLPAPYIGARLWERYSPQVPFVITSIAALITINPTWLFFKVPDDPDELVKPEAASAVD